MLTQWMDEPEDLLPDEELPQFEILDAPVAVETVDRRDSDRWTALGDVTLRWLDAEGVMQSVEGQMVDRSADGLGVISPHQFSVGDEIFLVLPKGAEEKAVVRHNADATAGWHLGLRVIHHERRRYERFPVDGTAHVHWGGDDQKHRKLPVQVKNIAHQGMQLRAIEELAPGTVVRVTGDTVQCVGVTWYCRPDGDAFLIGVQMTREPHDPSGLEFRD